MIAASKVSRCAAVQIRAPLAPFPVFLAATGKELCERVAHVVENNGRDPWFWQEARLRAQTLENVLEPRQVVKLASSVLKAKSTDEAFTDMVARRFAHYVHHGGASVSETIALWSTLLKLGVDGSSPLFRDGATYASSQFSQLSWRDNLVLLTCLLRSNSGDCALARAAAARFSDAEYCKRLSPSEVSMLLSSLWGLKLPLSIPMLEGVSMALRKSLTAGSSASGSGSGSLSKSEFNHRTISIVLNTLAFNKIGWEDHELAKLLAKQLVDLNIPILSGLKKYPKTFTSSRGFSN